jgi:hypothetical protein
LFLPLTNFLKIGYCFEHRKVVMEEKKFKNETKKKSLRMKLKNITGL